MHAEYSVLFIRMGESYLQDSENPQRLYREEVKKEANEITAEGTGEVTGKQERRFLR